LSDAQKRIAELDPRIIHADDVWTIRLLNGKLDPICEDMSVAHLFKEDKAKTSRRVPKLLMLIATAAALLALTVEFTGWHAAGLTSAPPVIPIIHVAGGDRVG